MEGSAVGIGKNGQYTNRQLMQGLVMASGNDAAHLLARQLGGDAATVDKMNHLADTLGAHDTRTATPSGLDGPGMSSSAIRPRAHLPHRDEEPDVRGADLAPRRCSSRVSRRIRRSRTIRTGPRSHWPTTISCSTTTTAHWAARPGSPTTPATPIVGGADHDGRRLMVTLMGAEAQPIRPWEQAARLLDYGFALDRDAQVGIPRGPASGRHRFRRGTCRTAATGFGRRDEFRRRVGFRPPRQHTRPAGRCRDRRGGRRPHAGALRASAVPQALTKTGARLSACCGSTVRTVRAPRRRPHPPGRVPHAHPAPRAPRSGG